jgi:hypothetical protein
LLDAPYFGGYHLADCGSFPLREVLLMRNARFVLAGLAAVMILSGDCPTSEARCRLFGRRARSNCAPAAVRTVCCSSTGGKPETTDLICPVQQTPYYAGQQNGVDYYMFYAYPYSSRCTGIPQPVYLPAGSPVGCTGTDPPCFSPSKEITARPPNLADMGHRLTKGQLKGFGEPVGKHLINFGTDSAPDPRNIDLYRLDVPKSAPGKPRPTEEVWIGIENPYASYTPLLVEPDHGNWHSHDFGKTVTFSGNRRPYYVLLAAPKQNDEK